MASNTIMNVGYYGRNFRKLTRKINNLFVRVLYWLRETPNRDISFGIAMIYKRY